MGYPVTVVSIEDLVEGIDLDCGENIPLADGEDLVCKYNVPWNTLENFTNSALVTIWMPDNTLQKYTAEAPVDFSKPYQVKEIDECIDVADDQYGPLGTVCAGDAPKTFTYSLNVGPYDVCGTY
jgi:hypothetical protein